MKKIPDRLLKSLEMENASGGADSQGGILAIDYGAKFCGSAFSPDGVCALGLGVFAREGFENTVINMIQDKNIKTVVFGLPVSGDGSENEVCVAVRDFAGELERAFGIEPARSKPSFVFVNERDSTKNIISSRKEKHRKDRNDDLSAVRILSYFLSMKDVV